MASDWVTEEAVSRSLAVSINEGLAAAVMLGILEFYVVPFGLFLNATTQHIGLLASLPQLVGACALLLAPQVVALAKSRLRLIVRGALMQAMLIMAMAILALVAVRNRIAVLIVLMIAYRVLMNLINPAWGSLMGDYLRENERGRYFGRRSQLVGLAQVAGTAAGGWVLFLTAKQDPAMGFALVLFMAGMCRILSSAYLMDMTDLPTQRDAEGAVGFFALLRSAKDNNFARFLWYVAAFIFAVFLVAPYFSVYMLRDLRFSYLAYMAVVLGGAAAGFLVLPIWGRHADLVGNTRVLKLTTLLIPLSPLLWLVAKHPAYLTAVEIVSGFVWGGFGLCATNVVYDSVRPGQRVRCLAYFNLIIAIAMCAGAWVGGWLVTWLPPLFGFRLLTLMALSGLLRFIVHAALSPTVHEARVQTTPVSSRQLFFSVVGIRPILPGPEERVPA